MIELRLRLETVGVGEDELLAERSYGLGVAGEIFQPRFVEVFLGHLGYEDGRRGSGWPGDFAGKLLVALT